MFQAWHCLFVAMFFLVRRFCVCLTWVHRLLSKWYIWRTERCCPWTRFGCVPYLGDLLQQIKLLFAPKFSPDGLEQLLLNCFGEMTLKDAKTTVLVPAFNISNNTVWKDSTLLALLFSLLVVFLVVRNSWKPTKWRWKQSSQSWNMCYLCWLYELSITIQNDCSTYDPRHFPFGEAMVYLDLPRPSTVWKISNSWLTKLKKDWERHQGSHLGSQRKTMEENPLKCNLVSTSTPQWISNFGRCGLPIGLICLKSNL